MLLEWELSWGLVPEAPGAANKRLAVDFDRLMSMQIGREGPADRQRDLTIIALISLPN